MKKKILCVLALTAMFFCLWATDIDSVLEKAKKLSTVYRGYELSYEDQIILKNLQDLKSEDPEIKVSGTMDYSKDGISAGLTNFSLSVPSEDDGYKLVLATNGSVGYSNKSFSLGPSALSVSLPSIGDDYSLELGGAVSGITFKEKKPITFTPSVKFGKVFEFSTYSDTRSEIRDAISELQRENGYKTNKLNFERTLINTIVSIMQTESSLKTSETSYLRSLKSYENDVYLGTIEEGSLPDINQKMRLESTRISIESQKKSLENAKKDFLHQYGFEFEEITEVRDADLSFEESEYGNSSVLIASLNLESAKQELEIAKGYKDSLSVSSSAVGSLSVNNSINSNKLDLSASVAYTSTSKNFSVSTTVKESFGRDIKGNKLSAVPSVTVSGSWSNKPTKDQEKELKLKQLSNNVQELENTYNNAVYNYKTNVQSLKTDIENHKTNVEQNNIKTQYDKAVLDYQMALLEKGLTTQQTVDDAISTYESDLQKDLIYKLQALVLENRIKTIEL